MPLHRPARIITAPVFHDPRSDLYIGINGSGVAERSMKTRSRYQICGDDF